MQFMKALIVVDMQNDFINGALGTDEAVAIVGRVVQRIKDSEGELVLFTQDTHQEDYLDTLEGKKLPVPHCIEGTEGWLIHEDILESWHKNPNTIRISELENNSFKKPVFGSLELVDFLKSRAAEIKEIEILGVCTDICVISNAIMIKNTLPNIPIAVNTACCAGVNPQSHQEALNTMKMCHIDLV
jgi:nicotinamidase-related amidase